MGDVIHSNKLALFFLANNSAFFNSHPLISVNKHEMTGRRRAGGEGGGEKVGTKGKKGVPGPILGDIIHSNKLNSAFFFNSHPLISVSEHDVCKEGRELTFFLGLFISSLETLSNYKASEREEARKG